ncbi:MAG TPA: MBL fold metallo-hydrolase [Acidimicrobiia bacterium]|jgi:UDP-MurNAc hydroxylase
MRFTVTGHSTLFVETSGPTILVDPWFSGSCYWRSWWHFPPSGDTDPAWLTPDYLYVTHDHFDHFHYPTVRRLDRRTKVLIPKFGVDIMATEFGRLGFEDVTELPHGRVHELAPDVSIASYQYDFDDTLLVIADGETSIWDINDCKIRGRSLRQVIARHGRPDVALKSHSFAQGYPNCYEADDPRDLGRISRQTFIDDFCDAMHAIQPRHAVPFASMVGFLHPQTRHCNEHLVTPPEVKQAFEAAHPESPTDVVLMAPGDSWDSASGFDRAAFDWYTDRERHLDELADIASPAIARARHEESERTLTFAEFAEFFQRFLRVLPPLSGRLAIKRPIGFVLADVPDAPYWVVDVPHRRVHETTELPADAASVISVDQAVLADAVANLIVHYIHISMRFHTRLLPGGTNDDLAFWGLLTIWELGYLPLHRQLRPRVLGAGWRRRAELRQAMSAAFDREGSFVDRMSGQLAAPSDDAEPAMPASQR